MPNENQDQYECTYCHRFFRCMETGQLHLLQCDNQALLFNHIGAMCLAEEYEKYGE